jgi:hypothetical protein
MNLRLLPFCLSLLLLQACSSTPDQPEVPEVEEEVPELTLNLPQDSCNCIKPEQTDYTFLEKGFDALHDAEYLDALQYFQRYQRIEKTDVAGYEAGIAVAYLSILTDSPIYDSEAARESYGQLRASADPDWQVHGQVLLMRDSLETFLEMEAQIERYRQRDAYLLRELRKREDAIKRLRDLTLGREPEPAG